MSLTRRELLCTAAGAALAGGLEGRVAAGGQAVREAEERLPVLALPKGAVAISSANGLGACDVALARMKRGVDPMDAAVAGVNTVEDDPEDHSVGYGGLPNEDGVVELDACVMHGPTHKAGAVAALRGIRNPSSVAALVMRRTDHVLIVGEGALRFAKAHGFKEEDLLTDAARRIWLKWKESHSDRDDWVRPEADEEAAQRMRHPLEGPEFTYGTISCLALNAGGDLGGTTTTSGLAYKIPGRVGDSPIIGAGLFVDNRVGACGSTGRGEANLINCSCTLIVEFMREGLTPEAAALKMLRRIAGRTEKRLRDADGLPAYQLKFYALRRDGLFGGAAMRGEAEMAVNDGAGSRLVKIPGLYPGLR